MILSEFSKYLQQYKKDLMLHNVTPLELLHRWLYDVMRKNPKNNADRIIHREILYCENKEGDYVIIGKSDSGRKLVSALINFAQSYENYNHAKWLEMIENDYHTS